MDFPELRSIEWQTIKWAVRSMYLKRSASDQTVPLAQALLVFCTLAL